MSNMNSTQTRGMNPVARDGSAFTTIYNKNLEIYQVLRNVRGNIEPHML
jgi:hypothetical protein